TARRRIQIGIDRRAGICPLDGCGVTGCRGGIRDAVAQSRGVHAVAAAYCPDGISGWIPNDTDARRELAVGGHEVSSAINAMVLVKPDAEIERQARIQPPPVVCEHPVGTEVRSKTAA